MTQYLRGKHQSLDVVVAVWMLNELFDKSNNLMRACPPQLESLTLTFASELKRFPYHMVVVGGSSKLWGVAGQFDVWAEKVRTIFTKQGIWVVDGIDLYTNLTMTGDGWHARSTPENKLGMA